MAVLSLVATPLLVWVSSAHTLYFDNQDDLGHPLALLAPFYGCFVATMAVGAGLLYFQRGRNRIGWLLWAYYLFGLFFLVVSSFQGLVGRLPHSDGIRVLIVIAYLGTVSILNRRHLTTAALRPFAFVSVVFLVGELYSTTTRYTPDETDDAGQPQRQPLIVAASQSTKKRFLGTDASFPVSGSRHTCHMP